MPTNHRQTDTQTEGRYQIHYLPRIAVDKHREKSHYQSKVFVCVSVISGHMPDNHADSFGWLLIDKLYLTVANKILSIYPPISKLHRANHIYLNRERMSLTL